MPTNQSHNRLPVVYLWACESVHQVDGQGSSQLLENHVALLSVELLVAVRDERDGPSQPKYGACQAQSGLGTSD